MSHRIHRREALRTIAALSAAAAALPARGESLAPQLQLATFSCDVTPPLGHPLMGGGIKPAERIDDPLFAHGLVLLGAGDPIVLCAVDWCEIRNDAYDRWREALATAAGTTRERAIVSSLHQHDTPISDLTAQRILDEAGAVGAICDLEFHEQAVLRAAEALRLGLSSARRITHYGTGQARVEGVASNRRYLLPDGTPAFGRTSAARDEYAREQPEGNIDPFLKTLSFWDGDEPLAAVHCYATHPMSYYGQGGVSADFVGLARRRRLTDDGRVFQMYVSGCSGNVTAGKFNDGSPENRGILADRMHRGMVAAWNATERHAIERVEFRCGELRLPAREGEGYTEEGLRQRLANDARPFGRCLAALGLSWRRRVEAGQPIDVPVVDLGGAKLLLLPGESYVEYQLLAQKLAPEAFVVTVGYGECGTGYIPHRQAEEEHDGNLGEWHWVAEGSEEAMTAAIGEALGVD